MAIGGLCLWGSFDENYFQDLLAEIIEPLHGVLGSRENGGHQGAGSRVGKSHWEQGAGELI